LTDAIQPARRRRGVTRVGVGLCLLVVSVAGCSSSSGSAHPSASAADDSYGSLPTFLPSSAIIPDSVLTGTASRPALTTEGDAVDVAVGDASLRATVSGPVVPGEGLPVQQEATTCTWTVTLSRATTTTPIDIADFTSLDHLGVVYPVAAVPGQPPLPTSIAPGQTRRFEVRAVMPTGEGLMRFAPDGKTIAASWDFEVEND
jgi:hypothetical protein